jgi:outer membrane protein assembly factor BamE (lipoprotein component of BamABCDE complex)
MKKYFVLLALLLITGCATSSNRLQNVNLGMSKSQVISTMGSPRGVSAQDSYEMFRYKVDDGGFAAKEYWFYFDSGKLIHYGPAGDFNTADPETKKLIIDHQGASH